MGTISQSDRSICANVHFCEIFVHFTRHNVTRQKMGDQYDAKSVLVLKDAWQLAADLSVFVSCLECLELGALASALIHSLQDIKTGSSVLLRLSFRDHLGSSQVLSL